MILFGDEEANGTAEPRGGGCDINTLELSPPSPGIVIAYLPVAWCTDRPDSPQLACEDKTRARSGISWGCSGDPRHNDISKPHCPLAELFTLVNGDTLLSSRQWDPPGPLRDPRAKLDELQTGCPGPWRRWGLVSLEPEAGRPGLDLYAALWLQEVSGTEWQEN